MKIVFLNRSILSGGIEKCIEILTSYIQKKYEIEIVYLHTDRLDPNIVRILEQYATVTHLENKVIECDICIFCYMYFDFQKVTNQIRAKHYLAWIHSEPREQPNCLLDNEEYVNCVEQFICVSDTVKNSLNIKKEGIVIHNFINTNIKQLANKQQTFKGIDDNTLKIAVVSRLSDGKGFDRLLKLVKSLEHNKIKYRIEVIGKGREKEAGIKASFAQYENVVFEGYKDNPYTYVKAADYLVMLSDYETWGNVITEAKTLGIPCVITNFPSANEQIIDNENGIIVPLDLENYDYIVERMIKEKENLKNNLKNFEWKNEIDKWENLFENI